MTTDSQRARHDLLTLAPADWNAILATRAPAPPLSVDAAALTARWGRLGWPVIVRRSFAGDASGTLPVGLQLPPDACKIRVALTIASEIECCAFPAVTLEMARVAAPASWQATIDALVMLGSTLGLVPRVFGALLWQCVTGLVYLRAASDLDLLWPAVSLDAMGALLDGLSRLDAAAPMRIDGEIRTHVGDVAWRELAAAREGGAEVVLTKSLQGAGFVRIDKILLRAPLCPPFWHM